VQPPVSTTSHNSTRQTRGLSGVQGLRLGVVEKPTRVHQFVRNNEPETVRNSTNGCRLFELNKLLVDDVVNGSQRIGDVCPVTRSYRNSSASTNVRVRKLTILRGSSLASSTRRWHARLLTSSTLRSPRRRGNTGRAGGKRRCETQVRLLLLRRCNPTVRTSRRRRRDLTGLWGRR
jgi:hypothetical protein